MFLSNQFLPRLALSVMLVFTHTAIAVAQPARGNDFFSSVGGQIKVEINKGTPVHLSAPAASVAIADPTIADVQVISPKLIMVAGRGVGETSVMAVDNKDNVILQGTVVVTHNISSLQRVMAESSPDNKVTATSVDGAIVLRGKVDSPVAAETAQRLATGFLANDRQRVINMLDTSGSDQVMLKVRVVELARSELKRFGINWESLIAAGSFVYGVGVGRDFVSAATGFDRAVNGDNSIFGGFRDGNQNINVAIDALENDGLVSVLAEPNLTARSGQQASFLAGGEIPIPVQGQNGEVTIQYRQFGVSLQFTPVVLSKDKISLTVLPEVSALSESNRVSTANGVSVPAFTTRRASTSVDLGSGQTFAIAGLLRNDNTNSVNKFPILGDVPVLGALFRSTSFRNDQTELVILVTPYIVKPIDDPKSLATPLDGYAPPTDFERIVLGRLNGETMMKPNSEKGKPVDGKSPAAVFSGTPGEAGFLMQ